MNRRIKQVWLLAILSSFLLIGLQTYWLYNSVTYSMGEMGKKNAEKAELAIIAYQTNIGAAVKEKSHIGYGRAGEVHPHPRERRGGRLR